MRLSEKYNRFRYLSSPEFSKKTFYYDWGEMSLLQDAEQILMKQKKAK